MKTVHFTIRRVCLLLFSLVCLQMFAQQRVITGTVISSEDGEPLIGAAIAVLGHESQGAITDIDGKFSLEVQPDYKMVTVSYLGMKTLEVRIPNKRNTMNIVMQPDAVAMEEVVVTGYGNFTKSSFTGSANTLKGSMMKDIPVMSD